MFDACPAPEDRPSPAETRAERRMRRLSRMADIGLSIAEKLERQAELAAIHAEVDAVPDNLPHSKRLDEIGRSFAQVSRAVSLATALEDRIDKGLPALPEDDRAVREREAREKRAEVARTVVDAIDADPAVRSRRRIVELRLNLDRLLDRELADLDRFLRRPFDEIEARLRRDLGLDAGDDLPGSADILLGLDPRTASRAGSPRSGWGSAAAPSRSRSGPSASEDAGEPSIPCRARSLPVRRVKVAPPGRAAQRQACGLTLSSPKRQADSHAWVQRTERGLESPSPLFRPAAMTSTHSS